MHGEIHLEDCLSNALQYTVSYDIQVGDVTESEF